MNTRGSFRADYGWLQAEAELASGTHPEVVAARLGEPVDYVLQVADEQRWPIRWAHVLPSPEQTLERFAKLYGFLQ